MDAKVKEVELKKREGMNVIRLQHENPNYSKCSRCGLPWNECESKTIMRSSTEGVFAICTFCWSVSDLEERLHHYKTLWYEHRNRWNHHYSWETVEENIKKESW